jgi:hypothetical protein
MELTPVTTVHELFRRSRADTDRRRETGGERAWLTVGGTAAWGTHLYRPHPDSDVNRDFVPRTLVNADAFWDAVLADAAPAVWDQQAQVMLTRDSAKALQRELAGVVRRYAQLHDPASRYARPYLVHLALAPHPA